MDANLYSSAAKQNPSHSSDSIGSNAYTKPSGSHIPDCGFGQHPRPGDASSHESGGEAHDRFHDEVFQHMNTHREHRSEHDTKGTWEKDSKQLTKDGMLPKLDLDSGSAGETEKVNRLTTETIEHAQKAGEKIQPGQPSHHRMEEPHDKAGRPEAPGRAGASTEMHQRERTEEKDKRDHEKIRFIGAQTQEPIKINP